MPGHFQVQVLEIQSLPVPPHRGARGMLGGGSAQAAGTGTGRSLIVDFVDGYDSALDRRLLDPPYCNYEGLRPMPDYRRWFVEGGTYFFTVKTYRRRKFLTDEMPRRCLREAINKIRQKYPFEMVAIVLLPDHLHTVWSLPPGDSEYPTRWKRIKEEFTESYLSAGGIELPVSDSRRSKGERGIWQRRYWEHTVRDEDDLKRCVDYTHWNPKKHGYVKRVRDWEYSSFHRFVALGEYGINWGAADPTPTYNAPEWGE